MLLLRKQWREAYDLRADSEEIWIPEFGRFAESGVSLSR